MSDEHEHERERRYPPGLTTAAVTVVVIFYVLGVLTGLVLRGG